MDKKNLLPGQNWQLVLEDKLKHVDFILVLISSTSVSKRGFVQREFKRALEYWQDRPESDIYLIPVKIDDCEVPVSLAKFHWIEYTSADFKSKVCDAILTQREKLTLHGLPKSVGSTKVANNQSLEKKQKNKHGASIKMVILLAIVVAVVSIASIAFFPVSNPSKEFNSIEDNEKDKVYNLILDYFDNIHSSTNAKRFFADHVESFYKRSNLTPGEIMKIRDDNYEFVNAKHKIDKNSITLASVKNGTRYWSFLSKFVCYRKSKNKFEIANVRLEFGLDSNFKIASIKENVLDYKFTKEKPTL